MLGTLLQQLLGTDRVSERKWNGKLSEIFETIVNDIVQPVVALWDSCPFNCLLTSNKNLAGSAQFE